MRFSLLLVGLLLFIQFRLDAQNYARLTMIEGAAINFNFNSIEKMKNGITLNDATIIGVTVPDSVGDPLTEVVHWEIQFKANNGAATIEGESVGNSLPLNVLELKADDNLGLGTGPGSWIELDAGYQVLLTTNDPNNIGLTNTGWTSKQIGISYRCGANAGGTNSVFGYPTDYYSVEIEILFVPYDF